MPATDVDTIIKAKKERDGLSTIHAIRELINMGVLYRDKDGNLQQGPQPSGRARDEWNRRRNR